VRRLVGNSVPMTGADGGAGADARPWRRREVALSFARRLGGILRPDDLCVPHSCGRYR
jgi:hypothetical protein